VDRNGFGVPQYWYAAPIMMVGRMLQNFGVIKANTGTFEVHPQ
jgi:hypothetical protein